MLKSSLQRAATPDQIFTLSRILFLSTATQSSLILSLVEDKRRGRTIIDVITMKLDMMLAGFLSDKSLASEAMTELLKFSFNILLHYPKVCLCDRSSSLNLNSSTAASSSFKG